jgi:hypothetical protein
MALKKSTTTNTAAFEQDPEVAVMEKEASAPVAPTPPVADAAVSATTAIAKAATSSLTSNEAAQAAKQFKREVDAMRGAADFSYGSHRVFKADNGAIKELAGEKLSLGRWVKVRLLAWQNTFQISPGVQGKDSGQFVAYSNDGKTIDHVIGEELKSWEGKSVDDYLTYLRDEEEFDKAAKREFIDTEVAVLGCEDEPEFTGVVQITLSSSSIPAFRKYQTDLEANSKCVAMGLPGYSMQSDPLTFFMIREVAAAKGNTWTKLKISATLPAKI